ncbi:hypothetical protein, partial [Stenotrophomonas maltophilia]|uniref:hypothetical protein n=1 Tax=Stenotrophomonas maltophilia TaxID=40324 RepID=UPI001A7E4A07
GLAGLFGDLQFETRVVSVHVSLGVGSDVQLPGVTSPWGLGRGIHAADTPPEPTRPATDRFLRGQPRKTEEKNKGKSRSLRSSMPDF